MFFYKLLLSEWFTNFASWNKKLSNFEKISFFPQKNDLLQSGGRNGAFAGKNSIFQNFVKLKKFCFSGGIRTRHLWDT